MSNVVALRKKPAKPTRSEMPRFKFDEQSVRDRKLHDPTRQTLYGDVGSPLLMYVTKAGTRSYQVRPYYDGKVHPRTLGGIGQMTVREARKEANRLVDLITGGDLDEEITERAAARQARALERAPVIAGPSVRDAVTAYCDQRKKRGGEHIADQTVENYQGMFARFFVGQMDRPLGSFTVDELIELVEARSIKQAPKPRVAKLRRAYERDRVGLGRGHGGPKVAAKTVHVLSGVYQHHGLPNLVEELYARGVVPKPGTTKVEPGRLTLDGAIDLAAWLVEQSADPNATEGWRTRADCWLFGMLTGLRRTSLQQLCWEHVDLPNRCLLLTGELAPDARGRAVPKLDRKGRKEPLLKSRKVAELPLSPAAFAMLQRRAKQARGIYVFPSARDPNQPTRMAQSDFVHALPRLGKGGMRYGPHDLRKVFTKALGKSPTLRPYRSFLLTHATRGLDDEYENLAAEDVPSMIELDEILLAKVGKNTRAARRRR